LRGQRHAVLQRNREKQAHAEIKWEGRPVGVKGGCRRQDTAAGLPSTPEIAFRLKTQVRWLPSERQIERCQRHNRVSVRCHHINRLLWLVLDHAAFALTQARIWLFDLIHGPCKRLRERLRRLRRAADGYRAAAHPDRPAHAASPQGVEFAPDSPLEEDGFELSVPR
jgi:hypothetical protein